MRPYLLTAGLVLVATLLGVSRRERPTVTYLSPTECQGDHGKWRWKVKTEKRHLPDYIPPDHKITPADMAAWEVPGEKISTCTPRIGREQQWYELTGKVVLVKAEEDGDLHIQVGDPRGRGRLQVVVEVPVDPGHPDSAWSKIRQTVFDWSNQEFPFTTKIGHRLHLMQKPVIRVVGKAFYDAMHGKPSTPNRRRDNPAVAVWEIHPVMWLEVVED
jgi:hypothetical protein